MKTKSILFIMSLCFFLSAKAITPVDPPVKKKFVVVLDAGHGGHDPGKKTKSGLQEKDIALKITLDVGRQLAENKDIKVIYTREKDEFIELDERGAIANRAKADLFVSIHCNAHSSQAQGAETYVLGLHRNKTNFEVAKAENSVIFLESDYREKYAQYNLDSPESIIGLTLMQEEYLEQSIYLASLVQDNFRAKLKRNDRSVKQAGFIVLHQTVMPSVLIETGFITNTEEGNYLNSGNGQAAIAKSIAEAIIDYEEHVASNELGIIEELPVAEVEEKIVDGIVFKVQIAASSKRVEAKSFNFKGLDAMSREQDGKLYKYYYGATANYSEIVRMLSQAKAKGYRSAFVVSFKNGAKVPMQAVVD